MSRATIPRPGAVILAPQFVLARPTGVGRALATYEIPIEGRDEKLAEARRLGMTASRPKEGPSDRELAVVVAVLDADRPPAVSR